MVLMLADANKIIQSRGKLYVMRMHRPHASLEDGWISILVAQNYVYRQGKLNNTLLSG